MYWPTSIKDTIKWFPFLTITENTANILNPNKGLIPSLLNVFPMIWLFLFDDKEYEEVNVVGVIDIRCINLKKETGLYLRN